VSARCERVQPGGRRNIHRSVGKGPRTSDSQAETGEHSVQLVLQGYKDWASQVIVKADSIVNVTGALEK